jgi:thiosulfate dehydrogenase
MFRGFLLGLAVAIIAAAVAAYFVVRDGAVPTNADGRPLLLEPWAAATALDAAMAREAPKGPNPVSLTDANLSAGITLYAKHCAICHGIAKGSASITALAKGLYTPPPQLRTDGVEDDPEGYSFWKIKHGIRWTAMPTWMGTLNDEQIWTHGQAAPGGSAGLAAGEQLNHDGLLSPAFVAGWPAILTMSAADGHGTLASRACC